MSRPLSPPTLRMKSHERWNPPGLTECVIQPSAIVPTRVSVSSEPPESACPFASRSAFVASQIGHGDCSGLGSSVTFENCVNWPANGWLSFVHRCRSTWIFSIIRLRRSPGAMLSAALSASHNGPAPPPAQTTRRVRPFDSTSSEAHSYAKTSGLRSANEPMQAGPSSTRSVRPATAASSANASSRRLTNSASPHHTESITGDASTASANTSRSRTLQSPTNTPRFESVIPKFMSGLDHRHEVALDENAGLHRHLQNLARGTRRRIRKHLHPLVVDRLAYQLLHPHGHLDDVLDRRSAGLHDFTHVQEHESALLLQRRGELRCGGIGSADQTGDDDVADAAGVGNRRLMRDLIDVNATAGHP